MTTNNIKALFVYTPMCGTCQIAGKMLDIVREMVPTLVVKKQDLNYKRGLAEEYGIESVPCLLLFRDDLLIDKIYAFQSVPYLLDKVNSIKK